MSPESDKLDNLELSVSAKQPNSQYKAPKIYRKINSLKYSIRRVSTVKKFRKVIFDREPVEEAADQNEKGK